MGSGKDTAIEIEHLEKHYDGFDLEIPSLSIRKGEVVGLIGENGAGKSTLIKLILNLIRSDGGMIRINGRDVADASVRGDFGVVFDHCCLSGVLSARDVGRIFQGAYRDSWDGAYYLDFVKRFSLPPDKSIKTFSHGMKAKLSMAAALAHSPKLLILDEATSNLDPIVRREINETIERYARRSGCTVLFSSHLVNELESLCDRMVLMSHGKAVLIATPEQLRSDYFVVEVEEGTAPPPGTLAWIRKESRISFLVHGALPAMAGLSITAGVSAETMLYYLERGERPR